MTGYGVGTAAGNGLTVTAEVRGVNSRFLDFNFRLPRALAAREGELREVVQNRVTRGRISVTISEEWTGATTPSVVDTAKARAFAAQLKALKDEVGLEGEVRLEHLLVLDEVLAPAPDLAYAERLMALAKEAMERALDGFTETAEREGAVLARDLEERTNQLAEHLEALKRLAAGQVERYQARLKERLEFLLRNGRLDPGRLEQEVAIAAERMDITEELVRLESHMDLLRSTLLRVGPVGKALGFVLQEVNREVNTIAAKSWDAEISRRAVKMKELLEQMREQSQNLE